MYTTINYVFACKCMCMYVHTYVRKHGDCWIHIIKSVWVSVKLGTKMWMVRQASKTLSPELSGIGSKAVTYFRGMNMSGFQTHGHIWPESDSKKCHTITRQTQPVPFTRDLLSIWTEGHAGNWVLVSFDCANFQSFLDVPELHGPVGARWRECFPVWAESYTQDIVVMSD